MIPNMTDPLGKHWSQPDDIQSAPMDETHVILTPYQFARLAEYSTSRPSGVYPGKCWKSQEFEIVQGRHVFKDKWHLLWYGEVEGRPDLCSNNAREIMVMR